MSTNPSGCDKTGCCSSAASAGTMESSEPSDLHHDNHLHQHGHHHGNHHHHHSHDHEDSNSVLCLAVVRENGTDVVIFDASGIPLTFRYDNQGTSKVSDSSKQLCFHTHGSDADLLTPCFDEHGNHGVPDESCFCGVDTPHIHAHLREMCMAHLEQQSTNMEHLLASQTLYPVSGGELEEASAGLILPVSDSMPKTCNSQEIQNEFHSHRPDTSYSDYKASQSRRILHKVQHDDHTDYLVHNAETNELHLEHACDACGADDVHGRFQSVGQRRLQRRHEHGKDVHLHFFEVAPTPFNLLEHFCNIFDTKTSDRVATVEHMIPVTPTRATADRRPSYGPVAVVEPLVAAPPPLARSILTCDGICCSSEVPMVKSVLEKLAGVGKIQVNVPLKQVIVHHTASLVTATDMVDALNKERFGAKLKSDGGAAAVTPESGRSQIYVQYICCASEIPAVTKVVKPIEGVTNVSINATTKMVFVDHLFGTVSAQQITDKLNQAGFGAILKFDAASAAGQRQMQSSFVRSTLEFEAMDTDTKALTQFLQTYDSTMVETFVVDVPSKSISVYHNPFSLSAHDIADALTEELGMKVTVSMDGADLSTWNLPTFDEQGTDPALEDHTPTYPKPAVLICGLLWIISMLSYIGGNW